MKSFTTELTHTYAATRHAHQTEDLLIRTTERLARKYGEVLHVSDIAHLLGKNEFRIRRWLNDSKSGRALRVRGTKHGRCVSWPVFAVAEFFVYGE